MAKPKRNDSDTSAANDIQPKQPATEIHAAKQEIFLPIHKYVYLFSEELAIVDHPAFQRLRRLRQLGLVHVVFPGATHTRFEHSLGALHVAQRIIDGINRNFDAGAASDRASQPGVPNGAWLLAGIPLPIARLIRLAALLHDIGHLPYGHTLEDELHHLNHHDGLSRLSRVCKSPYLDYELDPKTFSPRAFAKPAEGWSLEALLNALYAPTISALGIESKSPFDVLSLIICKAPKGNEEAAKRWEQSISELGSKLPLNVCRDIVGNTICADFLDYIYRDWYHIGKPFAEDERLFQYMEVRERSSGNSSTGESKFLINVGARDKIRHDALTNILDLLQARYKLAETVIFHRTKLAIIGLLDRSMLELRDLYQRVGLDISRDLLQTAEELLLDGSDDSIPEILVALKNGSTEHAHDTIKAAVAAEAERIAQELTKNQGRQTDLGFKAGPMVGEIMQRQQLLELLVKRLKSRHIYSLAYKLRMSDLPGIHAPTNPTLLKFLEMYGKPENRQGFLRGAEALLGIPEGALVMYVPPDGEMNAKIAKVNVFIEDQVSEFYKYETEQGESSLTRGALAAQVERFYELWSAQVFVEPSLWYSLSERQRSHLRQVIKSLLEPCRDAIAMRTSLQGSLSAVERALPKAARSGSVDPRVEQFIETQYRFPNGVPFEADQS